MVRERPIAEESAGIAEQSAGIAEQSAGSAERSAGSAERSAGSAASPTEASPTEASPTEASPTAVSPKQRVVATTARVLAYALLLALSGCVYISPRTLRGACSNDLESPIRNFCVVTPGTFWRGPRPDASDAQWLLDNGVRSIISLQLNDKRAFENAAAPPTSRNRYPTFRCPASIHSRS